MKRPTHRKVQLTRGREALVDEADYEQVTQLKWTLAEWHGRFQAVHYYREDGKVKSLRLQRFLLRPPDGKVVAFRNGDSLDCRRANLLICTRGEALSGQWGKRGRRQITEYKGVYPSGRKKNPFRAVIAHDYRTYHLGSFKTEEQAAQAYDRKAKELQGPLARLNFPESGD
jgi:hypothetical protein